MIEETLAEAREKMDKAVEFTQEDFSSIRTGRANPALFASIEIDYYVHRPLCSSWPHSRPQRPARFS